MMSSHFPKNIVWRLIIITSILMVALWSAYPLVQALASQPFNSTTPGVEATGSASSITTNVYVPLLLSDHPWISPFGVESNQPILSSNGLLAHATNLNLGYARMGTQISWAELQPAPDVLIDWGKLAGFENELRELNQARITPIVIVKDSPDWALRQDVIVDGQLTSCGPIAEEHFSSFASFVQELVNRYKTPEFNVTNWEIGNEPDVDPDSVPSDHGFGCWGDSDDTAYFGGDYYGEMLKVVSAAIKEADPSAKVWIGGLLLADPATTNPGQGYPERFIRGILASGAAPYIDVVAYHAYSTYWDTPGIKNDWDMYFYGSWYPWGGSVIGKARYLRQIMNEYGVNIPLFLNETGFGCQDKNPYCDHPDDRFFQSQATHLVRFYARALSENVSGTIWYTLDGPGWRYQGLVDQNQQPTPAYNAFKVIAQQLKYARYAGTFYYSDDIEAYAFRRNSELVHVVWAKEDTSITFYIPAEKFIQAIDRDGNVISVSPPPMGADYELQAGFDPMYVIRHP